MEISSQSKNSRASRPSLPDWQRRIYFGNAEYPRGLRGEDAGNEASRRRDPAAAVAQ